MIRVHAQNRGGTSVSGIDPTGRGGNSTNRMRTSSSSPATSRPAGATIRATNRPGMLN